MTILKEFEGKIISHVEGSLTYKDEAFSTIIFHFTDGTKLDINSLDNYLTIWKYPSY